MGDVTLLTSTDTLTLDEATGALTEFRPRRSPGRQLQAGSAGLAFMLEYLDCNGAYRVTDSSEAEVVESGIQQHGASTVAWFHFREVGGLDLDVGIRVQASDAWPAARWSATVRAGHGVRVVDLQMPMVVVPWCEVSSVVEPFSFGRLVEGDALQGLPEDSPALWELTPENGDTAHYPGSVFAQFLATCGDGAGVYLACEDADGHIKRLRAVRRADGIRLGVAHVGDWVESGERALPYETVLRSFEGDWYDAADMYRDWSSKQPWTDRLTDSTDVPEWLLDSPVHVTLRLQGYLDDGPAPAIEEFIPLKKTLPHLQAISDRVAAPLVAVIMSWERGGPWVYPDCFPPVGGDEHVVEFAREARARGWHVGSFCNGTRWVTRHLCCGYEGEEYFREHEGELGACRTSDGHLWSEGWDAGWRPSYACCMGAEQTRRIARDFVRRLIGWGLESIQYFDQNVNAATFPCFAGDHLHRPMPGKWMSDAMASLIEDFRGIARQAGEAGVIQSVEQPCAEFCLPLFQQADVRVSPPGTGVPGFIPLYHYLFHECIIMHGMMGWGAEPYHLPIRTAWNAVLGEIPGAVMTGDGTLLNRDTPNWALWEPKVGSNDDALEMLRVVTAMRRGAGRPFLVYGRMQRPARVDGIGVEEWEWEGRHHAVPAVAHAAWQAPDGRLGVVLANWTTAEQTARIVDPRLAGSLNEVICASVATERERLAQGGRLDAALPPLSIALIATT